MQGLNFTTFFAYIRKSPFGGRLTQAQVDGIKAILAAAEKHNVTSTKFLAYILATPFHETGGLMQPVREGFAKSDAAARRVVAKRSYGKPSPRTGAVYYGRGLVQLTWEANYEKMGYIIGENLWQNPDLALREDISAEILVVGMLRGSFTGRTLAHYFADDLNDPIGARRIINGNDKASLIATYYKAFFDALEAAQAGQQPIDVKPEDAKPDKPNLLTDKTTIGAGAAFVGAGGFSFLKDIQNGWAFAAFTFAIIAAIGVYLFLSGRIQIVRKAGA